METLRNGGVSAWAPLMLNVTRSAPQPAEPHEAPRSLWPRRKSPQVPAAPWLTWRTVQPRRPSEYLAPDQVEQSPSCARSSPSSPKATSSSSSRLKYASARPLLPNVAPAGIRE